MCISKCLTHSESNWTNAWTFIHLVWNIIPLETNQLLHNLIHYDKKIIMHGMTCMEEEKKE